MNRSRTLGFTAAALLACLAGCTTTTTPLPRGTTVPRSLALACIGAGGKTVALAECPGDSGIRALVGGGARGTISLAAPVAYQWLDLDPAVPGYTGLRMPEGSLPGPMAVDAPNGHAYVVLQISRQIARLDVTALAAGKLKVLDVQSLPFDAADVILVGSALWLTDPSGGQIARLDLPGFPTAAAEAFPTGASPLNLATAKGKLYVGNLVQRHVTVVDPSTGKVLSRIGIGPMCSNGIDDDGDGQTDRSDTGCDGPGDATEIPDEVTQSGDPLSACRNGLDDDGDGSTDFPTDRGCTGFGDGNESSELVTAIALPCANTLDEDEDGATDLDDADCYNRASTSEASSHDAPAALLAATFQGGYVAVADKSRRMLLIIDTATDTLILPQPGSTAPYLRASKAGLRNGDLGLPLPGLPGAIAAVSLPVQVTPVGTGPTKVEPTRLDFVAVALDGAGLLVVQLEAPALDKDGKLTGATQRGIGFLPGPTQNPTQAARPSLLLQGIAQELPLTIPSQYANFGPLRQDDNFGLKFTPEVLEHRSEIWHFEREGVLPNGERSTGTLPAAGQLVDGLVSFCDMGALTGDWLLVDEPACQGQAARTVRYPITAVHADSLDFDAGKGVVDVPVTRANQESWTPALELAVPQGPALACLPAGGVHYTVRAQHWLVSGTKSGLSSRRPALGAQCAALTDEETKAARLFEPKVPVDDQPYSPPDCPLTQLPAEMTPSPYQNLVFSTQILPACEQGPATRRLLPSLRGATWSFPVFAGFTPRASDVGAAPVAAQSGPTLSLVYVVDEGLPALFAIDLRTGERVPGDKQPLQ